MVTTEQLICLRVTLYMGVKYNELPSEKIDGNFTEVKAIAF